LRKAEKRQIRYPITVGVKIDYETREELDIIALFDRKKVGTWLRDLIVDAVNVTRETRSINVSNVI